MTILKGEDAMKVLVSAHTFIVLDTESTGFQPDEHFGKLTQIAAVRAEGNKVIPFNSFINPGIHIPSKITQVTGIDDELVKEAPDTATVLRKFYDFCNVPNAVLVGHNMTHDMRFLDYFMERIGLTLTQPCIDTLDISRKLLPKSSVNNKYNLENLARYFNIPDNEHHKADNDAMVTYELLKKLQEIAPKSEHAEQMQIVNAETPNNIFVPSYYVQSVRPWIKQMSATRWTRRIYVNLKAVNEGKTEVATVFYDYDTKMWDVKETTFVLPYFDEIQKKVSSFMSYTPGLRNTLCAELSKSGWVPDRKRAG